MIHILEITSESNPDELRKLFRKKLMTGGGVIRIAPGVTAEQEALIFDRFVADAAGHNLSASVLEQLATQVHSLELLFKLCDTEIPQVVSALRKRTDLPGEVRSRLKSDRTNAQRAIQEIALELSNYSDHELRLFFQRHLGEEEGAIEARLALCRVDSPRDLFWLMSRDANREVRFAARNRLNQVR